MNRRQRRRRARLRRAAVVTPVALALGWLGAGLGLPVRHAEEARVVVSGSAETVWAVLMDLDAMPNWRDDVDAVERLPDSAGAVRWREIGRRGETPLERVEARPPERMVVRALTAAATGPRWTYQLAPTAGGVILTVLEERPVAVHLRPLVALFGSDRRRIEAVVRGVEARVAARHQLSAAAPGARSD